MFYPHGRCYTVVIRELVAAHKNSDGTNLWSENNMRIAAGIHPSLNLVDMTAESFVKNSEAISAAAPTVWLMPAQRQKMRNDS